MNRIAVFLDEEEVTEQVSSLKNGYSEPYLPRTDDVDLGLENATLKWNEVPESPEMKDQSKDAEQLPTDTVSIASTSTRLDDSVSETISDSGAVDHVFELKDISISFPEGQLTVVTGPTASGKTALLVCCFSSNSVTWLECIDRWLCSGR